MTRVQVADALQQIRTMLADESAPFGASELIELELRVRERRMLIQSRISYAVKAAKDAYLP